MAAKKTLIGLPDKLELQKLCQSLAILDAIIEPEWEFRYSSFNSKWSASEMLATMRNGGGDEYFTYFNDKGVIIKGFDHESEMNVCDEPEEVWKGVLDDVPNEFENFLTDKAFPREYTTFCLWRLDSEGDWKTGKIQYPKDNETADGSNWLLFLLDGKPETYLDWATDYYERNLGAETVEKIYRHEPLIEEMIQSLNPERSLEDLKEEIEEIGYPHL
jgi:hypothetical protein